MLVFNVVYTNIADVLMFVMLSVLEMSKQLNEAEILSEVANVKATNCLVNI